MAPRQRMNEAELGTATIIDQIREVLATLTPAERRIAEVILDRPHAAISWSITELSRLAQVSDPSVVRFCRRMGCAGFPALKLAVAHALARIQSQPRASAGAAQGDAVAGLMAEILQRSEQSLREAHADLAPAALREAAAMLAGARFIAVYGFGISGYLAQEAQYKLASLGLATAAYSDPMVQATTAPLLGGGGAVLAFSFSGLTHYLRENLALARDGGARVVTVAPAGSPVALLADVNLPLNGYRKSENFMLAPTARIAFHMILDMLCATVVEAR